MPIISISRGSYIGGKMLADYLHDKLGYRCVDRDLVVQRASEFGVSEAELREAMEAPPSFLGQSKHTRYVYLALIQAALMEEVWNGNTIYYGLAGHLLLKGVPHLVRTRIIAPMEFRVRKVQERMHLGRKEAVAHIEKMDSDRRKWTLFLYGVDWESPALYDVVLNLEHLTIEQAGDVVCIMAKQKAAEFTAAAEQSIDDLVLASQVRAQLAIDPATSDLELEITADHGAIAVKGDLLRMNQGKEIKRVANAVRGVTSVSLGELALANHF